MAHKCRRVQRSARSTSPGGASYTTQTTKMPEKKQRLSDKKEKETYELLSDVLAVTNRYCKPWLAQTDIGQRCGQDKQHEQKEDILRWSLL